MSWLSDRLPALSGPVIVAAAVAGSAWFAARLVTHIGEAEAFDDRRHERVAAAPPPAPGPTTAPVALDPAGGTALVERNMFCSSCPPPGPGGGGVAPPDGGPHAVPRLIATQVGGRESWATLDDPASGVAGLFMLGASLPGGGVIETIEPGAMVVRFPDKTTQRVVLATGEAAVVATKPTVAAADAPWSDRVRAVGDNRWEVDRTMIRDLVSAGAGGGGAGVKGVRLAPVGKDGALAGVRVAMARDGSLAKALGLQTGDVIESIDGRAIDSAATLMQVYGRLDDLRRVDLGIKRKGAAQTLTYDLP